MSPLAGEERDSDKRTMGWVNNLGGNGSDMGEKFIAAGPIPPVSIPAALLAAIGNGVVAGAVIAATTPAGFDESSFTIGAVSGTILLVAMVLSGVFFSAVLPGPILQAELSALGWSRLPACFWPCLPHQSNSQSSSRACPRCHRHQRLSDLWCRLRDG
jgi:hypothetical protein